jgi:hypothetical protein
MSTVHEYLKRAEGAKVTLPLAVACIRPCTDPPRTAAGGVAAGPRGVHEPLRNPRDVTVQLLWEGATEVAFCGLDRDVAKKELNLL